MPGPFVARPRCGFCCSLSSILRSRADPRYRTVAADPEFENTEPSSLPGGKQIGSRESLVTLLSINPYVTLLDACFCVKTPYFVCTVDASMLTSQPWLICTRVLPVRRTPAHQAALPAAGGHFKLRDHQQKAHRCETHSMDGLKRTFDIVTRRRRRSMPWFNLGTRTSDVSPLCEGPRTSRMSRKAPSVDVEVTNKF